MATAMTSEERRTRGKASSSTATSNKARSSQEHCHGDGVDRATRRSLIRIERGSIVRPKRRLSKMLDVLPSPPLGTPQAASKGRIQMTRDTSNNVDGSDFSPMVAQHPFENDTYKLSFDTTNNTTGGGSKKGSNEIRYSVRPLRSHRSMSPYLRRRAPGMSSQSSSSEIVCNNVRESAQCTSHQSNSHRSFSSERTVFRSNKSMGRFSVQMESVLTDLKRDVFYDAKQNSQHHECKTPTMARYDIEIFDEVDWDQNHHSQSHKEHQQGQQVYRHQDPRRGKKPVSQPSDNFTPGHSPRGVECINTSHGSTHNRSALASSSPRKSKYSTSPPRRPSSLKEMGAPITHSCNGGSGTLPRPRSQSPRKSRKSPSSSGRRKRSKARTISSEEEMQHHTHRAKSPRKDRFPGSTTSSTPARLASASPKGPMDAKSRMSTGGESNKTDGRNSQFEKSPEKARTLSPPIRPAHLSYSGEESPGKPKVSAKYVDRGRHDHRKRWSRSNSPRKVRSHSPTGKSRPKASSMRGNRTSGSGLSHRYEAISPSKVPPTPDTSDTTTTTSRSSLSNQYVVPPIVSQSWVSETGNRNRPQRDYIDSIDWTVLSPRIHAQKQHSQDVSAKGENKVSHKMLHPIGSTRHGYHKGTSRSRNGDLTSQSPITLDIDETLVLVRRWNRAQLAMKEEGGASNSHMFNDSSTYRTSRSMDNSALLASVYDEKKNNEYMEEAKHRNESRRHSYDSLEDLLGRSYNSVRVATRQGPSLFDFKF